jgi:peptidyl-prolyl cis-trans isomerase-like protein 2
VPVDSTDKPLKPITIKSVAIFGDPFEVYKDKLGKRLAKEEEARDGAGMKARKREENKKDRTTWMGTTLAPTASSTAAKASIQKASGAIDAPVGVGKYMKREAEKVSESSGGKKRKGNTGFGSFDSW